jgi:prevent-host-death family protein
VFIEAKDRLAEIINQALSGEEIVITREDKPLVKLVPILKLPARKRLPGSGKGQISHMADDFDAPLQDFKEYM